MRWNSLSLTLFLTIRRQEWHCWAEWPRSTRLTSAGDAKMRTATSKLLYYVQFLPQCGLLSFLLNVYAHRQIETELANYHDHRADAAAAKTDRETSFVGSHMRCKTAESIPPTLLCSNGPHDTNRSGRRLPRRRRLALLRQPRQENILRRGRLPSFPEMGAPCFCIRLLDYLGCLPLADGDERARTRT